MHLFIRKTEKESLDRAVMDRKVKEIFINNNVKVDSRIHSFVLYCEGKITLHINLLILFIFNLTACQDVGPS